jgi:hypothetical protein
MGLQNMSFTPLVWPAAAPKMAVATLNADLATVSVEFDQTTNQVSRLLKRGTRFLIYFPTYFDTSNAALLDLADIQTSYDLSFPPPPPLVDSHLLPHLKYVLAHFVTSR